MRWRNDAQKYGAVAKALHWGVALLVLGLLPLGWYMSDLPRGIERFRFVELHKSLGLSVLALMLARSLWRAFNPPPPLPASLPGWEHWAARLTHYAIYLALFTQAAIGISIVWAANSTLGFFGLFALHSPISPDHDLKELAEEAHGLLAIAIVALLVMHIAAALRHHFILKNDILRRMLQVMLLGICFAASAKAATWNLLPQSQIQFHFVQGGVAFTGQFKSFQARIEFDPEIPEAGRIDVMIDTASLDTQNSERDAMLRSAELFDVERWPQAQFTAGAIRQLAPGQYEAAGALSIRDITRPLSLPFSLKIGKLGDSGGDVAASASGEAIISRRDFGLGQGPWADTSIVADEIKIEITVEAVQQR